jgi:hypothetical protein
VTHTEAMATDLTRGDDVDVTAYVEGELDRHHPLRAPSATAHPCATSPSWRPGEPGTGESRYCAADASSASSAAGLSGPT